MGKTFQNVRVCAVGQLEDGDKIPRWVRANGGNFQRDVDESCTHLIATEHAYKSNVEAVRKAKELGTVRIVSFEWLEDSLLQKSRRPKPEAPYLLEMLTRPAPKGNKNTKKDLKRKGAVTKTTQKRITKHQVYEDPSTGDRWSAILIRPCKSFKPREKYQVAVFETSGYYQTYAKHSRIGVSSVELLSPAKTNLALAVRSFEEFFKLQTGKEWDERGDGNRPLPKLDLDGRILPAHEGWYTFEDNTSIFTKFIMEARSASTENTSAPDMEDASNNGGIESVISEDSSEVVDEDKVEGEDSGNDGDLESCAENDASFDKICQSDDAGPDPYDSLKMPST